MLSQVNRVLDDYDLLPAVEICDCFFYCNTENERRELTKSILTHLQIGGQMIEFQIYTQVAHNPDLEQMVEESFYFLIQYEFIRNDKDLCAIFYNFLQTEIGQWIDTQPSAVFLLEHTKDMLRSVNEALGLLTHMNQLVFKFIHERSRMWRPFIATMISVLKTRVLLSAYRTLWERCFIMLLQSIRYWDRKHFLFASKSGFETAVASIMIDDPTIEGRDLQHDSALMHVFNSAIGHLNILDRRNSSRISLFSHFIERIKQIRWNQSLANRKKIEASRVKLSRCSGHFMGI